MEPDSPPPAPAVVAVVVTFNPGPWFDEVLASLGAQDYPNLSVLVIDAGSNVDPTPSVASVLPGAFVHRMEHRVGFGTAANEVLTMVEGASHFLLCHDDVVLDEDAVHLLVEEAFRSNAGIASPKYVLWDAPDRLLAVGLGTDKVGVPYPVAERGELDQQQHDAVREVLVAPSGATLVRADLFEALGGFDPDVDQDGEDVNLCWRARLAGARITVVPSARVRHLEATRSGVRTAGAAPSAGLAAAEDSARRSEEHRYRTVLTCYRWHTLLWAVPLALFWALGEALTLVVQGRFAKGWSTVTAPGAALARPRRVWSSRRRVQTRRQVGDAAIRRLQVRGNSRLRAYLQSRLGESRHPPPGPSQADRGRGGRIQTGSPGQWRAEALVALFLLIVLLFGSRGLLGGGLPQVGRLPDTSIGWAGIWSSWWSAWQPAGLGVGAPSTPALALLGLAGTVLFGAVGTLEHVVVLGALVVGPFGAYRAARHWGSRRGQLVAAVFYAVVPLPYNALALGHWDGLVVYAAVPWVFSQVWRLSSLVPLPAVRLRKGAGRFAGLAVLVAATSAVAPSFLYVVLLIGVALLAGSALAGGPTAGVRSLLVSVSAAVAAFVLLLPWSATVVASRVAILGPSTGPAGRLGLGEILRFHTGPYGTGGWEWLLLVAAALPLLVGSGWRLEWASRLWVTALLCFAVAWAGRRGWIPALPVDVVLAPAAAALASSAALGAAAFELDLPAHRFGWRQAAAGVAGVALALGAIPWVAGTAGGRWDLPSAGPSAVLALLPSSHSGAYRILWVGAPDAVPLAGRELEPGFAYGTSLNGPPTLADEWAPGPPGAAPQLAADLHLVESRLTTKFGHLLATAGIRYVVVPHNTAPSGAGGVPVEAPEAVLAGLALQTDMHTVDVGDSNYTVYENSAWAPVASVLPVSASRAATLRGPETRAAAQNAELSGARPVVAGTDVRPGSLVYLGSTRSGGWHLRAGGHDVGPIPAFGWAMAFRVPAVGSASGGSPPAGVPIALSYGAPVLLRVGDAIEILLWVAAVGFVVSDARRRARGRDTEVPDERWFAAASLPSERRRSRVPQPSSVVTGGVDGDDLWVDI